MPEPHLHGRHLGPARKRAGRGRGPEAVGTDGRAGWRFETELVSVVPDDVVVDRLRVDRFGQRASGIVFGSIWIPGSYESKSSSSEPNKALPRLLTL